MSYSANQYNYATPLSSTTGLVQETSGVNDAKYFTLFDNKLDGSYVPMSGDVGLWGNVVADADGSLTEPFVVTVTEDLTINAVKLVGSAYSYPAAFTIDVYSNDTLMYSFTEDSNDSVEYVHYLPKTVEATHYTISVTKVSSPNSVARLYSTYNPTYVKRVDTCSVSLKEVSEASLALFFFGNDTLYVKNAEGINLTVETTSGDILSIYEDNVSAIENSFKSNDSLQVRNNEISAIYNIIDITTDRVLIRLAEGRSHITNIIEGAHDTLKAKVSEGKSAITNIIDVTTDTLRVAVEEFAVPTNVHTAMKQPSRHIYGRVFITYTDPMLEIATTIETSSEAYNSNKQQLLDGSITSDYLYFTLYDNNLTGLYAVPSEYEQVGWTSAEISDADGVFSTPPYIKVNFESRPILALNIAFDDSRGNLVKDFDVTLTDVNDIEYTYSVTDNKDAIVDVLQGANHSEIVSILIEVRRVERPFSPAVILDIPVSSTILYRGYKDVSDLMSIDLLEELTYEDEIEALGGVSANEVTVVLDNSNKDFFFNSGSIVANHLRRNRKIVPWLGVEIKPGEIEWYTLGTYWSYKWTIPVNGLTASVVGFDTIGLLGLTDYVDHQVQINKSVGELVEYILKDARKQLYFIEYVIDNALYDIMIPYAWFERDSHAAALRKISRCYPMHIYCDRKGRICAKAQKLKLDYYYDVWADDTNVISKDYSSLYTTLPNIVNVTINNVVESVATELVRDETVRSVEGRKEVTLSFSKPYLSGISIDAVYDDTLSYTYEVYSWGIVLDFIGSGNIESIVCTGVGTETVNQSIITRRDEDSIRLNGAVTRSIESDFIQTTDLANKILDRVFSLSELDKFDATVTYRGDMSLTINDPILLQDGIAPDNRYNIKRHKLFWNGSLSGSAELNT